MSQPDDAQLTSLFAPARELVATEGEVAAVLRRAMSHAPRRRLQRPALAVASAAVAAVLGLGYATAPPLRAAFDSVADTFAGWTGADGDTAPGRPATADDRAPEYMRDGVTTHEPRVIAQGGAYRLFGALRRDGTFEFDLGNTGFGVGGYTAASFARSPVMVLGPGALRRADADGHVPLFGITARTVRSVELTYESGPPLRLDGIDGGFVLLAEPVRHPVAVIARDANGGQLARVLVDDSVHPCPCIDWDLFTK
jgi:hypothetical protein